MKTFSLFGWVDYFRDDLGTLLGIIGTKLNYYWQQMTLLSVLIVVMIVAIIGLSWLALSDRKKYMSKAYWRGYEAGKKEK